MTIDRQQPGRRPAGKNDGTQRWESLLFCHWEIDPQILRPHVPAELDLDTFQGRAYVGIVPFKMRDIRPSWLPKRFAFNFLETNVRTYVTCNNRPGVYFFSLDANSRLAVHAARIGWSLPYYHATMTESAAGETISYASHRGGFQARHQVSFRVRDRIGYPTLGSLEHFLVERYLLFVQNKKSIHCGQVHHSPYEVWNATIDEIDQDLIAASGIKLESDQPCFAHYSPGVDVEVFAIQPVDQSR